MNASLSYTHQFRVRANTDPEDRKRYERGIANQFWDMVMEGKKVKEISEEIGLSKQALRRILKNVLSDEELYELDKNIAKNRRKPKPMSKEEFLAYAISRRASKK